METLFSITVTCSFKTKGLNNQGTDENCPPTLQYKEKEF
jgi:hypothetical protein